MAESSNFQSVESARLASRRQHCHEMVAAYRTLLGNSAESHAVAGIYDEALQYLKRLDTPGPRTIASLAIVGHVGAGKTWLTRCFLATPQENLHILDDLRSGEHEDTQHATWLGPESPANAGNAKFICCPADRLIDLGRPYVICDSPGYTHARADCRDQACGALVDSQIKLFVTAYESLRDGSAQAILQSCEGAIVVPVIRLPTKDEDAAAPSDAALKTVAHALAQWRQAAPASRVIDPIFMPNEYKVAHDVAVRTVQERLRSVLTPLLANTQAIETSIAAQADHRVAHADQAALLQTAGVLDKARTYLANLDDATRHMSDEALRELVGDEASLKAVIRQQLRTSWIERTWDGFFPYKPFLRTLALTAGAWDRLAFVTTGSLPSLAMTALQVGKNVREGWRFSQRFNLRLAKRIEASLADRLQPDLRALAITTARAGESQTESSMSQPDVRVHGIEELQECSRTIFAKAVARHSPGQWTIRVFGWAALALFIAFIFSPAVSVFSAYIRSCIDAATHGFTSLAYSLPTLSMLLGVATISSVPSLVLAWAAMLAACTSGRVKQAAKEARSEHVAEITQRLSDQRLRFEVLDPKITALRKVLAVRST